MCIHAYMHLFYAHYDAKAILHWIVFVFEPEVPKYGSQNLNTRNGARLKTMNAWTCLDLPWGVIIFTIITVYMYSVHVLMVFYSLPGILDMDMHGHAYRMHVRGYRRVCRVLSIY